MPRHLVAPVGAIPPGGRMLAEVGGKKIAIFNLDGTFFGLLNRCPHQGGDLCRGTVSGLVEATAPGEYRYTRAGEILRCPWHGWEFDIRTGRSCIDPQRIKTRTYPVERAQGTAVVADAELQAETIPVMVEQEYVIVEL
ncbi:MAG TPA: Rieske (2Fe-2S) protein [Roseomonas sp.]|nr:Rieske (2Fe-2S) protein [Roseomonas sp.]